MRLDKFILEKFDLKSRTYAENLVLTGRVSVAGRVTYKPSLDVDEGDEVEIIADEGYASQGAYKLKEAFRIFKIDVAGKSCADIGCSNGGFTDVLLREGAAHVLAVDVGACALDERLAHDERVEFLKANARDLPHDLQKVDFACTDLSFISLKYVLREIYTLLKEGGEAVALIKPQFELDKSALSKKGIVLNEKYRQRAVESVKNFAISVGFEVVGCVTSPIRYEFKNVEYLLYLKKTAEK